MVSAMLRLFRYSVRISHYTCHINNKGTLPVIKLKWATPAEYFIAINIVHNFMT